MQVCRCSGFLHATAASPPPDFGRGVPAIAGPRPRAATRNWSAAAPRPHSFQGSFHTPRAHWSTDAVDELFLAGGCSVTPAAAGHPGGGEAVEGLCLAVWSVALEGGVQRPRSHQGTAPPILPGGGAARAAAAHVTQCSRPRLSVRCGGDAVAEIQGTIHGGTEHWTEAVDALAEAGKAPIHTLTCCRS